MRKLTLLSVAFAMFFASCSNGDKNESTEGKLSFEISTVNKLDTRANLYSEEAVHEVERVDIYVFKSTDATNYYFQKTFSFTTWEKGTNFKRYDVADTDMLPAGDYKFLAVGRDLTDNFTSPSLNVGMTKFEDMLFSVASAGNETEIFAGSVQKNITSAGARIAIQMTRQVAGVLGYFIVPAQINSTTVRYLRLKITDNNLKLNVTTGTGSNPTGTEYNLFNVDFSGRTVNGDGVYVGNDLSGTGVVKLDNTQLNGAFVIPVDNITLTLGLYDTNNNPLRTWVVKDAGNTTFPILANHFYSLGKKQVSGSTTGGGSTPEPDAPINLMIDQDITITISPDWASIHNLTIE